MQDHRLTPATIILREPVSPEKLLPATHSGPHSRRSFFEHASTATILLAASTVVASSPSAAATTTAIPTREQGLNLPFPKLQFDTVADVPDSYFTDQTSVYALVERVIDGDTVRVRHAPLYGLTGRAPEPLTTRAIADRTMSIRVYGVDCPEVAKFGNPAQPYAEEAKQFTTDMLLHKVVKITFLRRDQYGRAISAVQTVTPWWTFGFGRKDLTVELAKAGLAELYTGGGAEYYNNRNVLEQNIAQAQAKGLGIWSLGSRRTSAAEFKRNGRPEPVPVARNAKSGADRVLQTLEVTNTRATPAVAAAARDGKGAAGRLLDAAVTGLEFAA